MLCENAIWSLHAKTINKPCSCLVVFGHVSSSQPVQTAPPFATKSPSVCPAPVPTGPGQSSGRRSAYNGCVFRAELFEQWEWRDLQVARWLFVQSWAVLNRLNMLNLLNHPTGGSFEPYHNYLFDRCAGHPALLRTSCDCDLAFHCRNVSVQQKVYTAVEQRLTVRQLLVICSLRWKLHG